MGHYCCGSLEDWNALNGYTEKVCESLDESKTNFFWLGVHLIDLYSSNLYRLTFDREKLGVSGFVGNCCAECFFAYCFDAFGLDKTRVSRLMNIVDEFGDGLRCFKKEWEPYSYSQLCELLPLSTEDRKPVKPDWTIKKIREYKKSLSESRKALFYHFPIGHSSEANFSFAKEQPHFRHFPIPRRAEAFQYWHLSQIAWRFAKVSSSVILKPTLAQ